MVSHNEVDSGACDSLLHENYFYALHLNIPLEPTNISFRSYSDNIIKPIGKVAYDNKSIPEELVIIPPGHEILLDNVCIRKLWKDLNEVGKQDYESITVYFIQLTEEVI